MEKCTKPSDSSRVPITTDWRKSVPLSFVSYGILGEPPDFVPFMRRLYKYDKKCDQPLQPENRLLFNE